MDDSWRMRMGSESSFSRVARKSMDEHINRRSSPVIEAEDFSDVFGGPPRTVFVRKFSRDFTRSTAFYDEIFQPPGSGFRGPSRVEAIGRTLPAFRVPSDGEGFYSDVFGSLGNCGGGLQKSREWSGTNSRAKAKSNSSFVPSSEDGTPHRRAARNDAVFSSFASKLRPINIPTRSKTGQQKPTRQRIPAVSQNHDGDNNLGGSGSSSCAFSRRVLSPETISLEPNSFRSIKLSSDDLGSKSPAFSPVSLVCKETEPKPVTLGYSMINRQIEEQEDEVVSSYLIEINSDHQYRYQDGGSDSFDIDEAIAWAKEKFMRQDGNEEMVKEEGNWVTTEEEEEKTE